MVRFGKHRLLILHSTHFGLVSEDGAGIGLGVERRQDIVHRVDRLLLKGDV